MDLVQNKTPHLAKFMYLFLLYQPAIVCGKDKVAWFYNFHYEVYIHMRSEVVVAVDCQQVSHETVTPVKLVNLAI